MDHYLPILALLLGAAGWLFTLLAPAFSTVPRGALSPLSAREKSFWWLTFFVAAGVLGLTLPSRPPFSPGVSLGPGFMLGNTLWLVTARLRRKDDESAPLSFLWAGIMAVTLPGLVWPPGGEKEALAGVCLGIATTALLLCLAPGEKSAYSRALVRGSLFAITVAAGSILGLQRAALTNAYSPQNPSLWQACAVLLAVVTALGLTVGQLMTAKIKSVPGIMARLSAALWQDDDGARVGALWIAVGLALAGGAFVALQTLEEPALALVFGLGLLTGFVVLIVSREGNGEGRGGVVAPMGMLVMLAGFMAAFGMLQGYGAAVLLLGAQIPLLMAPPARCLAATRVLLFGLGLVLYRMFASRYGDGLRNVPLNDNYALFATAAGLILPGLPALWAKDGEESSVPRTLAGGLVVLAVPAALILFYGSRVGLSLSIGLALGSALRGPAFCGLWSVATSLAIYEGTRHLQPLAELTRHERLKFLVLVAAAAALIVLACDITARFKKR